MFITIMCTTLGIYIQTRAIFHTNYSMNVTDTIVKIPSRHRFNFLTTMYFMFLFQGIC